ncbi:MAG TPA: glycoside hydrolase family 76 protein [Terracidiphilus sp.]|nr:glycoside hydrolase family 76 protein [Terracidiphilus sp.]
MKLIHYLSLFMICLSCGASLGARGEDAALHSPAAPAGSHANPSGALSYAQQAGLAVATLQTWYSQTTGLYASPAGWWHSANAITVLANYARVTGDRTYDPVIANTFTAAQKTRANFLNDYFDDDGWWALAWIDAYDLTGNRAYLSMSETIFSAIATNGWNTKVCGGGVWWSVRKSYKNAVPNELFLDIAAKLANRTSGAASAAYLHWANQEWAWFKASGMINGESLINDGLVSTNPRACVNNGGTTWTYNQGVILGGLVELSRADHDPTLLTEAQSIANAAIAHLSSHGILIEAARIGGGDAPQFKGIFMRNLMALYGALPAAQAAPYKAFADANAASIWTRDRGPANQLGCYWQGPFDAGDGTRETSALDALIAAAAMQ